MKTFTMVIATMLLAIGISGAPQYQQPTGGYTAYSAGSTSTGGSSGGGSSSELTSSAGASYGGNQGGGGAGGNQGGGGAGGNQGGGGGGNQGGGGGGNQGGGGGGNQGGGGGGNQGGGGGGNQGGGGGGNQGGGGGNQGGGGGGNQGGGGGDQGGGGGGNQGGGGGGNLNTECKKQEVSPGQFKFVCDGVQKDLITLRSEHILWLKSDGNGPQVVDIEVPNYKIDELIKAGYKTSAGGNTKINVLLKRPEQNADAEVDVAKPGSGTPSVNLQYEPAQNQKVHFPNDKPYLPLSGPILPPLNDH